ncbi:MAG: hypothetical protein WBA45_07760 [Microthrixaceae bacterium]
MRFRGLFGWGLLVLLVSCSPPSGDTFLEITTIETTCGGVFNPDVPTCQTRTVSRQVQVSRGNEVVTSGTTGPAGRLLVAVPSETLVVSFPNAEIYMDCDAPTVTPVAGMTTPVTQTCTLYYP